MGEEKLFPSRAVRDVAVGDAESLSRRDESVANVLRGRALRGGEDRYGNLLDSAAEREAETAAMVDELQRRGYVVDKSGTRADFTDSYGNLAPNALVANTGGVGVDGSNSTRGSHEVAMAPEEVDLGPVGVGVTDGDKAIGSIDDADERRLTAPTDTRDMKALRETRAGIEANMDQERRVPDTSVQNPPETPDMRAMGVDGAEASPTPGLPSTETPEDKGVANTPSTEEGERAATKASASTTETPPKNTKGK